MEELEKQISVLKKRNEDLIKRSKDKIAELENEISGTRNIELYKALFEVKKHFSIKKKGEVKSGRFSYKFFKLEDIFSALEPLLETNGLYIEQYPTKNETIATRIIHLATGQKTALSELKIIFPKKNAENMCQEQGKGITYAKRYSLAVIFGIVTEEDTDGN